jgi:hypothetical protein
LIKQVDQQDPQGSTREHALKRNALPIPFEANGLVESLLDLVAGCQGLMWRIICRIGKKCRNG